ncbi:MAG: hemolysin family protein [bacterium]
MDIPYAELAGIGFCLVFSAFFAGSETALTSLSDVKVLQLLEKYPRWAGGLRRWQKNHTGILTTILIGNNLSNITASALAADLAGQYFQANGIPIAIGGMTFLLLFTGEITPKTFARRYASTLAPPAIQLVTVFHVLFFPVTWVITTFIRLLFAITGGDAESREKLTEEDIEFVVGLGHREGVIDKQQESLLSSVFEFSDTTAKEILVPRTDTVAIALDTPYEEVLETTLESGFSRIPVYEDSIDRVVGIFHTKNLIIPPKANEKTDYLRTRMGKAVFVPESKKISEVLKLFQKNRIHMAIVVNEFGGTEGIVTMEDIIEELLGEIQDEFDMEEQRLLKNSDGSFTADARVDIEAVEEALGLEFPEDREYESLGGFLMELAGDVPTVGWKQEFGGFAFTVVAADANRVIKITIEPVQDPAKTGENGEEPLLKTGSE